MEQEKPDMLTGHGTTDVDPSSTLNSILVVDDHPANLLALAQILQTKGYKVRKATSGAMTLETVRVQAPSLILLDVRMSPMDGFEVCETLKRSPQTCAIPILFVSASDELSDKVKAFDVGGADYITKPFRAREVLARVSHQLLIQHQQQVLTALRQQVQHLNTHLAQEQAQTQALQLAITKLQQLHQLKDDFITMLAQELCSPTANIQAVQPLLLAASRKGKDFFQALAEARINELSSNQAIQSLNLLQDQCEQ